VVTWTWTGKKVKTYRTTWCTIERPVLLYDSRRNHVLALGTGSEYNADNHKYERKFGVARWNGKKWKKFTWTDNAELITREWGFSAVYDAVNDRVILFGGTKRYEIEVDLEELECHGDTWEFKNGTWKKIAETGPAPRVNAASAIIESTGEMLLFGGEGDFEYLQAGPPTYTDLWSFQNNTWQKLADNGPQTKTLNTMVYDQANNKLVVTVGQLVSNEIWEYDNNAWTKAYSDKTFGKLVYDTIHQEVILLDPYSEFLYKWNGTTFQKFKYSESGSRGLDSPVSISFDRKKGKIVAFGEYKLFYVTIPQ
jgi:hypothetical protein